MSVFDVVFDYSYPSPLHRLVMLYIQTSGSQNGTKEKIIFDKNLLAFCCCRSSELIEVMNYLVDLGVVRKINYGLQFGRPASGYVITQPTDLGGCV